MVVPDLRSLSMRENARFRQWQAMYFERRALNPNLPGEHFYQTKFEDALEIEVMRLHSPKKPLFFEEIAFLAERMTTFYILLGPKVCRKGSWPANTLPPEAGVESEAIHVNIIDNFAKKRKKILAR